MEVILRRLALWAIFITLPIIIILTSVELITFNKSFYEKKYQKFHVEKNTGINQGALMEITDELLDYIKGTKEDLVVYGEVHGQERLIFDERDQAHMVDVKELFIKGFSIRNTLTVVFIISFIYLAFIKKYRLVLAKVIFYSIVFSTITILLLAIIISTNFSKYFDTFHYIFFDNDLWILDPKKSILINLVPLGFFIDVAIKIAIYVFSSFGLIGLISGFYYRKGRVS